MREKRVQNKHFYAFQFIVNLKFTCITGKTYKDYQILQILCLLYENFQQY